MIILRFLMFKKKKQFYLSLFGNSAPSPPPWPLHSQFSFREVSGTTTKKASYVSIPQKKVPLRAIKNTLSLPMFLKQKKPEMTRRRKTSVLKEKYLISTNIFFPPKKLHFLIAGGGVSHPPPSLPIADATNGWKIWKELKELKIIEIILRIERIERIERMKRLERIKRI